MFAWDVLCSLPTDISGSIVRNWLSLKDTVGLDSAVCERTQREVLHSSIFQSPTCAVCVEPYKMSNEGFEWICKRLIISKEMHIDSKSDLEVIEAFLTKLGEHVAILGLTALAVGSVDRVYCFAHLCPRLQLLSLFDVNFTEAFAQILQSIECLECFDLNYLTKNFPKMPTTRSLFPLKLKTVALNYCATVQGFLFQHCQPESLQRLRVSLVEEAQLEQWHQFVNLHTLSINYIQLTNVAPLQQCPSIVNLDLCDCGRLTKDHIVALMQALPQLRALHLNGTENLTDNVLQEIARCQHQTMEALYMGHMWEDVVYTPQGINHLLSQCSRLHTLSCVIPPNMDFSLLQNLTTLIIDYPEHVDSDNEGCTVWRGVQQYCKQLQHLHIRYYHGGPVAASQIIEAVTELPKLQILSLDESIWPLGATITTALWIIRPDVRVCETSWEIFDISFPLETTTTLHR